MSGPPLMRLALTSPAANTLLIAPVVTWSLSVKRWARQAAWAASTGANGDVEKTTRSSRISTTRRDLNSGRRRRAEAPRPRNRLHGHFHRDFMGFLRQPGDHDAPASAPTRLPRKRYRVMRYGAPWPMALRPHVTVGLLFSGIDPTPILPSKP